MKKLEMFTALGWTVAALLALRMLLPPRPVVASPPVVAAIRASCDLPPGTVVFVVRDRSEEAR